MTEKELKKKIQHIIDGKIIGVSLLQRTFWIGYSRAAKILDALVDEGCVLIGSNYKQYTINEKNKDKIESVIISNLPAYQKSK